MLIGVLQQLRGSAFACAGRRNALRSGSEDSAQVFGFSPRIQHVESSEQPHLQGSRPLFPFLLAVFYHFFVECYLLLLLVYPALPCRLLPLQFGLAKLAFANQGSLLLVGEVSAFSFFFAQSFGFFFLLACQEQRFFGPVFQGLQLFACLSVFRSIFVAADTVVDGRYLCFFYSEKAVGLQQVVHGRDEIGMLVASGQIAREGRQKAYGVSRSFHDEYPEHFTCL